MKYLFLMVILVLANCGGGGADSSKPAASSLAQSSAAPPVLSTRRLESGVYEFMLATPNKTLRLFVLDDDLLYVSYSLGDQPPVLDELYSEMIADRNYDGPEELTQQDKVITTAKFKFTLDDQLCVEVSDLVATSLTKTCSLSLTPNAFAVSIHSPKTDQAYGLGSQFFSATDKGNWLGKMRTPGSVTGNRMVGFEGGAVSNTQIPVLLTYQSNQAVGYFLDAPHAQTWNFTADPWTVSSQTSRFGLFIFAGDDLVSIRKRYLKLTGTPLVPPKAAFGLWLSEYGYDNWAEAEAKIAAQREAAMPLDGIILDLQWFGGITQRQMGSLNWNAQAFPNPRERLEFWKETLGVSTMVIEEPYIDHQLSTYADLDQRQYLVRKCNSCGSTTFSEWWGTGGMLDWTNEAAASYWHTNKRTPLIAAGVAGHWTDLGEPENYDSNAWYADTYKSLRHDHASAHNLYNFYWSKSIYDGYRAEQPELRPLILSRSGTAGSQRFGAILWSGDIASNFKSLAAHWQAQMHMSMSGYDYFGSDVGGFHRRGISSSDFSELYTLWFASSALFDIPLRPHTENLCNCKETAPALVGDSASNHFNLQRRYQLFPYYYSLAYQAYLDGSAIFPPLAYYHPDDTQVIGLSTVKYIGPYLIARVVSDPQSLQSLPSYIPAGQWMDFSNHGWINSAGEIVMLNAIENGITRAPLLAREGAIIPLMYVDDHTMNLSGQRSDSQVRDELIVRILSSEAASEFTLYEDDGISMAYQQGDRAATLISQQYQTTGHRITISASDGTYVGMPEQRSYHVELFTQHDAVVAVTLNDIALPIVDSLTAYVALDQAAFQKANGLWLAKSSRMSSAEQKQFIFWHQDPDNN